MQQQYFSINGIINANAVITLEYLLCFLVLINFLTIVITLVEVRFHMVTVRRIRWSLQPVQVLIVQKSYGAREVCFTLAWLHV